MGRQPEPLQRLAAELGDRADWRVCDVADPGSVTALADSLADVEISIVINNAGIAGPVAPLTEIDPKEWDEVFAINVRGVYLVCRAFLPAMVARGHGDVINLASVSGKRPLIRRTPYCASKMAVIGLTSTLAFEVGPAGVNVNSLSPGPVDGAADGPQLPAGGRTDGRLVRAGPRHLRLPGRAGPDGHRGRGRAPRWWPCWPCPGCAARTSICRRGWSRDRLDPPGPR